MFSGYMLFELMQMIYNGLDQNANLIIFLFLLLLASLNQLDQFYGVLIDIFGVVAIINQQ